MKQGCPLCNEYFTSPFVILGCGCIVRAPNLGQMEIEDQLTVLEDLNGGPVSETTVLQLIAEAHHNCPWKKLNALQAK